MNGNPSPSDLGMSGVVAGNIEEAIMIEAYPQDKYQDMEEGRVTVEEFAADLVRHAKADIERRARSGDS